MHSGVLVVTKENPERHMIIDEIMEYYLSSYEEDYENEEDENNFGTKCVIDDDNYMIIFDYYTIGGAWNNTFNKNVNDSERFTMSTDGIINIQDYSKDYIKDRIQECISYIIFAMDSPPSSNIVCREHCKDGKIIENPKWKESVEKILNYQDCFLTPVDVHE